jgi:Cof subfamily protein (haloacid dehalogenase superfamily)
VIRLIGIDIDGTLLDSQGRLSDENVAAIAEAVSAGVHVALVTGRSYPWARPVAERLPEAVTLIVSNGAVERLKDGSTVVRRLLKAEVARDVLLGTTALRASTALIFDRDHDRQMVFETMDWEHPDRRGYYARNAHLIAHHAPLEAALTEDPIQVMFNGDVEPMRELTDGLRSRAVGYAVSLTEYPDRNFSLVDVTAPEATKGQALAWKAAQLGLEREAVMAIGDNFNDLEMLEMAGLPVVMANAVGSLKTRGWAETASHDASGVGAAIRRFVLQAPF